MTKCNNDPIKVNNYTEEEPTKWNINGEEDKNLFSETQMKKIQEWRNKKVEKIKEIEEQKERGWYNDVRNEILEKSAKR